MSTGFFLRPGGIFGRQRKLSSGNCGTPACRFAVKAWLLAGFLVLLAPGLAFAAISVTAAKSVTTGATAATSLTITPIAAAVRADLLVAQLTLDDATATVTKPAGWTEITTIAQSGTGIQQRVYWMIRSNTEPASYVWTFSKAVRGALILADIRGVDTNQAINASDGRLGTGTSIVAPEVASAYTNGMLVSFFGTTGTGSSIAPQAGMTVPANGTASAVSGSAGVQLALAYEQIASDGLTGVRTATGASGNYVGQTIAITPAPAAICFTDNFNRATLGSDWATSYSKGTFTPLVRSATVSSVTYQRLQLTENATNQATLATLQRYFPAAGNNVVVSFRQYAYPNGGGTGGGDGISAIFSDATVAPAAGADGGSMGYAQKTGVAGFAGGWLGVGLDEYGNFSNATEGRYKGNGAIANSVAVRGPSNSFYTVSPGSLATNGYPYVAGTAALSPEIDSSIAINKGGGPGYLYRITIDSRVPGEQWIQVERSTDGGTTYSTLVSYFNLMSNLSTALGASVTLPSIPANFWLSFASGTGSATNLHEIDDLQVCATKMVASTAAIDHFRFENPGTIDNCQAKTIKVTACTDAAPNCTQFTGGDVYVTLKPSGWVGGDTVKLIGGSGILQLSQAATGTVTLDIDKTKTVWPALKDAPTYASHCVLPGTSTTTSCNLTVTPAASGFGITFPSTSQVACDDSGDILIKACSSGYAGASKNLQFWFGYTDPSTTADPTRVLQLSKDTWTSSVNLATTAPTSATVPAPVAVTFDSTATARVRVKYADVGKLALSVRDAAATTVSGSSTLVVRPASFVVTGITDSAAVSNPAAADATGAKFVAAGMPFKVTAEARNNCATPSVVKNFGKETIPEGIKFDKVLTAGLGLTDNPALTTITDFSFTNGAGTTTLSWPEVGIIKLTPRLKSGSYMGTADVVGVQTGNVGRFFAHHLDVGVTQGCSLGSFTYDRQPFPLLTISAKAAGSAATLANYKGSSSPAISFAKPVSLTDTTGKGTITVGGAATVPVLAFSAGTAALDGADANHPLATYSFTTNPTAASTIGIAATDSDNSGVAGTAGAAGMRSGRVSLGNAYGSELINLPLDLRLQYWAGTTQGWQNNAADLCTAIQASDFAFAFTDAGNGLAACETAMTIGGTAPNYVATLTKPGAGNAGWSDITLNLGSAAAGNRCTVVGAAGAAATTVNAPWLQFNWSGTIDNPTARATFGRYKAPLIYRRENY